MKRNLLKIISVAILLLIVTIGCKKDHSVTNVTLDQSNITLIVGEMETITATVHPEDATNKNVSWTSSNSNVADVVNGIVTAKEEGKTTITVITEDGNFTAECVVTVTPKWIEISGVKWAQRNVDVPGTFTANSEDTGMFYQWNRKTGWSSTDPMINSDGGTIWDTSSAEGDTWKKVNDPCPSGWRVPTHAELQSLVECGSEWSTLNGIPGRYFGSGEQIIFLPAAGSRDANGTNLGGSGLYWSSSKRDVDDDLTAGSMHILSNDAHARGSYRNYGISVRCVAE